MSHDIILAVKLVRRRIIISSLITHLLALIAAWLLSFILLLHTMKLSGQHLFDGIGLTVLFALTIAVVLSYILRFIRLVRMNERGLARYIESEVVKLGIVVSGTVELLRKIQNGASKELAAQYGCLSARKLADAISHKRLFESAKYSAILSIFSITFLVVVCNVNHFSSAEWLRLFSIPNIVRDSKTIPDETKTAKAKLFLGNINVSYVYPAYTRLPSKTDSLTAGRIKAVRGTGVRFSALIGGGNAVLKAKIAGGETIALSQNDRSILAEFTILRNGALELYAHTDSSEAALVFRDSVICEIDRSPTVSLASAAPLTNIRRRDKISLLCRANDDYGLRSMRLIFLQGEHEGFQNIGINKGIISYNGETELDLSLQSVNQDEDAFVIAEVTDNDAVSGFKSSRSQPVRIGIINEKRVREELNARLKELESKLLHLLADHLEDGFTGQNNPASVRKKSARFDSETYAITSLVLSILVDLKESDDVFSDDLFETLETFNARIGAASDNRRNIVNMSYGSAKFDSLIIRAEEGEINELEDVLIRIDDFKKAESINEVMDISDELNRRGRELSHKLEKLSDSEKIQELAKEFRELQKDLQNLLEKLTNKDTKSGLPEEFLNTDALKQFPSDDLMQMLKDIVEALKSGDTKAAQAAMEKLRDLLDKMASSVASAQSSYENSQFEKEMESMQQMVDNLDKLIDKQTRLNLAAEKSDTSDHDSADKLASMQQAILQGMQGLKGELEGMGKGGESGMGSELQKEAASAISGLGSSYNEMSAYKIPSSLPHAKKGLYHMSRLKEGLKQGMNDKMRNSMGGSCPRGSGSTRGSSRGGRSGTSVGRIELVPDGKEGKIRSLIRDAVKEEGPNLYQHENRKYYEEIGN